VQVHRQAVQFFIWKRAVDVPVLRRGIAVEVVGAKNDFERAAATDQWREALGAAAPRMHPDSDFRLAQQGVLARRKTHIAGEHEFAADPRTHPRIFAMLATGDLVMRTNVSIRIGKPEGRPRS